MKIGFIGLGKMGQNMCLRLLEKKHKPVVYDIDRKAVKRLQRKGAESAKNLCELVDRLPKKKVVWLMVPSSQVDAIIAKLAPHLKKGDIVIDGGNSYHEKSIVRYMVLKKRQVHFLDVGTSGGTEGAREGACMMIGGDKAVFKKIEKLFKDLCVKDGYGYMGKSGAGHFVKMAHNAIEYGMMGAIGEGMEAVKKHSKRLGIDMKTVAKVYSHGSIIQGRLMSWLEKAMTVKSWKGISGKVPEGETEKLMKKFESTAHMPVLHAARIERVQSREGKGNYAGKTVAAMRKEFGGHEVKKKR